MNKIKLPVGSHGLYTALLLLTMTLWGSMYVSSRVLLDAMPVMMVLFFRFFVGGAALLLASRLMGLEMIHKKDLPLMLFLGLVGYFLTNILLTICTKLTSASLSSLLNSINPLFIMLFAHLILGEQITRRRIALIVLAIIGAAIIIGAPGANIHLLGIVCALGSIVFWSVSSILMKRLTARYHPMVITAYGQGIAGIASLIGGGIQLAAGGEIHFSPVVIGNIAFISLCCTALSHMLWNLCMAHEDASRCASFYPIQPMVSMIFGFLLLHERMTPSFLIGSAIIIISVALNSLPGKKEPGSKDQ